jgi:hypothetical protein
VAEAGRGAGVAAGPAAGAEGPEGAGANPYPSGLEGEDARLGSHVLLHGLGLAAGFLQLARLH